MKIDRDKTLKAVAEYVYFLLDNRPENPSEAATFDARRRALHKAIAESVGVEPGSVKDTAIADGLDEKNEMYWKRGFDSLDEYISYRADQIIDKAHNDKNKWSGIEIQWEVKERIPFIIKRNKKRIGDRIKEVDAVMVRAMKGLDAWNLDHPRSKTLYTWDVGINTHDWNGLRDCIKTNWAKMEALAEMPREAYTKLVVVEYLDKPLDTIKRLTNELEGIAFRAERTKYYKISGEKVHIPSGYGMNR